MSSIVRFDYSQSTFGGSLACTAIATLSACGIAEGQVSHDSFRSYCSAGSQMWKRISNQKIAVYDVLNQFPFFQETYDIESYQCSVDTKQTQQEQHNSGLIPVTTLLEQVQKDHPHTAIGLVFTDGCASFSAGCTSDTWMVFDSHCAAVLFTGPYYDFTTYLLSKLHGVSIVDCTTFVEKDI